MAEADMDDLIEVIEKEGNIEDIPRTLPMMPVRDIVVFTDMLLPLFVGRDKSIKAIEECMSHDRYIFLTAQKDADVENPGIEDLYEVGTVGRVQKMIKLPDGRIKALVQGIVKAKAVAWIKKRSFFKVEIEVMAEHDPEEMDLHLEALMRNVKENSEKLLSLKGELSGDISDLLSHISSPGKLADLVAANLNLKTGDAQGLLELNDTAERLCKVNDLLARELALSTVQAKIQTDVKDEISKNQRDYYLREQVKAIHRELGESDEKLAEIKEFRAKIKRCKLPKVGEEEAIRQLRRLEQMHSDSSEASVVRTYLDTLVELPWSRSTKDVLDIARAQTVLDKNHFGLEKVKERILEYLSVRKLNPRKKGQIICFVGPPGVGKTSLGQAIAKAMKRKFHRVSLGGIRDEAEIRGHRRTYIGSMPGRILQGLRQCGTNNPVFMLDEIDKLGNDFRGDPSSALLEALDPEQNFEFSDHYLNIPFDLSNVMFILTANIADTIPSALLDRMEVIRIPGYTHQEKIEIARTHLLPRKLRDNGLIRRSITINDKAMAAIVTEHTLEAGLRELERKLDAICRKIARKIAEGQKGKFTVTRHNLTRYLGPPQYLPELDQEESQVGLATGLAWTEVGGETLYIEISLFPGKGELLVTGQIGEIMQESARAALTWTKSNQERLGIDKDAFDNQDIHIHVPAGAIPKDGPSAGIAMVTALVSAFTGRRVDNKVAMTGEVSLRGRVLPIGGLKEKALGALRAGIKQVVIPEKNKKDLYEIPKNIKAKLKFTCVRDVEQVLEIALEPLLEETEDPEPDGSRTGGSQADNGQADASRTDGSQADGPEAAHPGNGNAQAGQADPA
ncbi:MAG: endopeptidase La [Desulfotignum sp.]